MIRAAKFFDAVRIVELMHELHAKSRYKTLDAVDDKAAHRLVTHAIHRHGHLHDGGALVMVSVRDQRVEGFIIGMLDRTYHIGKKLMAQDVFLYLSKKADAADAVRLVKAYIDWATNNPKVIEVKLSWTDALPDAERIEQLYERLGFRRCGAIWSRDMTVELEAAA